METFAQEIANNLQTIRQNCYEAIEFEVSPQGRALLETTAEVIRGLELAYEHYFEGKEKAWKFQALSDEHIFDPKSDEPWD